MTYRVDIVVHYSYDIETSSLEEAKEMGLDAFYEDETVVGDVYGELYHIDVIDENGNVIDERDYYDGVEV